MDNKMFNGNSTQFYGRMFDGNFVVISDDLAIPYFRHLYGP